MPDAPGMPKARPKLKQLRCNIVPEGGKRAVVVLAPEGVAEFADRFRRQYDKEWFERVPPHISVLGPFEPREADEKMAHLLIEAAESTEPVDVRLALPDAFLVPELFLFLRAEEPEGLHKLHARVLKVLPHYAPPRPYHPHLTLGRFVSEENLARALAEVRQAYDGIAATGLLEFRAEEMHLFGEDPETGVYQAVATIGLRGDVD